MLTKRDVAERLKVSERTVSRWIAQGELQAYDLRPSIRISEADLQAFLAQRKTI